MQIELTDEYLVSQGLNSSFPRRLMAFVKKTDSCWLWTGNLDHNGYGQIGVGSFKKVIASRGSWLIHKGPIPEGLHCCHKCDEPSCVNPDHLFLGTRVQNMQDAKAKRRTASGDRHPATKIKESDIPKIRELGGVIPHTKIAAMFGVSASHISSVIRGKERPSGYVPVEHLKCDCKLNADKVTEIRSLFGSMPVASIARRYGVHPMTIHAIKDGKSWKHVKSAATELTTAAP